MTITRVTVGIAAFLVPQLALFLTRSQPPMAVTDPGWFLNSGRNVATIASVIGIVSALIAARRQWRFQDTATFGLGVLIAMVATLFTIGPGTIFPIVIVVGAVVAGVASLVGTAIGYAVQIGRTRIVSSRGN